ncbi:flagellar hook-length control protein FliK [Rhodobacteraceae bacterium]|nr:flagellar hook-length control protein FliK [Paracoccaceae bacterium]
MSLANIPLIELNKSVSASLSGTHSHADSGLGDNFSSLLKGPICLKSKTWQEAASPDAEDSQKTAKITKLIAKLNSADVLEQSDLLLEGSKDFGGLENLISELRAHAGENKYLLATHENSTVANNKEFYAFLSLLADFRKQIEKTDDNEVHLGSTSRKGELDLKNTIEVKPLNMPEHSRTPDAAYPNDESRLISSIINVPIELPAELKGAANLRALAPSELGADLESGSDLTTSPTKFQTPTLSHSGLDLEASPNLSAKPKKFQTPISSEHGHGLKGNPSEIVNALAPEDELGQNAHISETLRAKQVKEGLIQNSTAHEGDPDELGQNAHISETLRAKQVKEGLIQKSTAQEGDPDELGQNAHISETLRAKQVKEDLIQKSTAHEGNPKDKIVSPQTITKTETKYPLVDRNDLQGKQAASFPNQESKTLKTAKPGSEPNIQKSERLGKTTEQATKKISIGNENKSKIEIDIKNGPDIKGSVIANKSPSPEDRQPSLNATPDQSKYQAFSDNAFRLRPSEVSNQKNSLKSRSGTNFAVDKVATSFAKAIEALNRPQASKNTLSKDKFEAALVETYTPRPLSVQVSNSTSNISNSPSLEMLEKWVDSQLDLNSRGWVSNLSKSMLSALSRGQQKLTITLSPESLGKLNVTFANGVKGLDIRINAERQATAALIGDAEAKLVSNIEASGQRVASVTCSSSNSFENAYNSSQNSSSNGNNESSDENRKSQTREPEQNVEKADSDETVGKSNDDDTIVNITV